MSTFGRVFRVTTFGESHCKSVGCIIDGSPPRMVAQPAGPEPGVGQTILGCETCPSLFSERDVRCVERLAGAAGGSAGRQDAREALQHSLPS